MTDEEIKHEVREQLIQERGKLLHSVNVATKCTENTPYALERCINRATEEVNWFLSQPNLAIIDPEAELPRVDKDIIPSFKNPYYQGFLTGQHSLVSQGWVKRIGGK
jgi:hypothetical protein